METILDENPSKEDVKLIYGGLIAFNTIAAGAVESKPFAVLLRDTAGSETVGGLYGALFYGWAYVSLLFIPSNLRGQGFGVKLLAEAETFARANGSQGLWLDTYTFQAPGFYEKAGFEKFGELTNFPPGYSRIFYRKTFI